MQDIKVRLPQLVYLPGYRVYSLVNIQVVVALAGEDARRDRHCRLLPTHGGSPNCYTGSPGLRQLPAKIRLGSCRSLSHLPLERLQPHELKVSCL